MVLTGVVNAFVYKKKQKEFEERGQKLEYYRVIIDVEDEVEEFPCTKECYDEMCAGKIQTLNWNYNSRAERNPFKFTGVSHSAPSQNENKGGK